jgi:hypothetical protein
METNSNTSCANQAHSGIVKLVMTAIWFLVPLALMMLAPMLGARNAPFRDKRGSWRNYR